MRIRLESSVQRAVFLHADKNGVMYLKLNVIGQRGWPDAMFLFYGGHPLFVEFKRPGGKPRKLQRHIMEHLECRGYEVVVVENAAHGKRLLDQRLVQPAQH